MSALFPSGIGEAKRGRQHPQGRTGTGGLPVGTCRPARRPPVPHTHGTVAVAQKVQVPGKTPACRGVTHG